ncbi:hypothetical protein N431DRAFT_560527 [Stipitochalara longipes BDJ]|nr:hypothetical protein N431DRAFT_560527 [Stipitochalara longipes BDJ]
MLHSKASTGGEFHRELPEDRESREISTFKPPEYQLFYALDKTLQWDPPADSRELAEALSYHFPMEQSLKTKMQAATKVFLQNRERSKSIGEAAQPPVPRDVSINQDLTTERRSASEASVQRPMDSAQKSPFLETFYAKKLPIDSRPLPYSSSRDGSPKKPSQNIVVRNPEAMASVPPSSSCQNLTWSCKPGAKPRGRKRRYEKDEAAKVAANRGMACEEHQRRKVKCDPNLCPKNKKNLPKACSLNLGADNQEILPSEGPSQGITHRASSTNALSELMKPIEHANRAAQIHPPCVSFNAPSPFSSPFSPRFSEVFSNPSGQHGVNWFEKDPILANNNFSNWKWSFDDAGLAYSDTLFPPSMVSLSNPITFEQSISFNPNESSSPFSSMGQDVAAAGPHHALSKSPGACPHFSLEEKFPNAWDMLEMLQKLNRPNSSFIRISECHNQHVTGSGNGAQKLERQFVNKALVESLIWDTDECQDSKLAPKDDGVSVERVSEMPEAAKSQTHVTDDILPAAIPHNPDSPLEDLSTGDINTTPPYQIDVSKVPGGESESLLEIQCLAEEKDSPLSCPWVHSLRNRTPEVSLARKLEVSQAEATQQSKESVVDGCGGSTQVSFSGSGPSWDRVTKGINDRFSPPISDANVNNLAAELGDLKLRHW